MSGNRQAKMCGLFKPGHVPHWIQMSRATEDKEDLSLPCRIVEARQSGAIVIEVGSQELHLWNHEPERLTDTAAQNGRGIEYQSRWGLLWLPSESGKYAFSVARSLVDYIPCPPNPPIGSPVEVLRDSGGFTVSMNSDNHLRRLTRLH